MSHVARLVLSTEGAIATGFTAVMWVWAQPFLADIVEQYPGPFTSSWDFINVIVPVTIGLYYIVFIGYVLWGPINQERARQTGRVR